MHFTCPVVEERGEFGQFLGAAAIGTAYFADLSVGAAMPRVVAAYTATALLSLRLPRTAPTP